MNISIASPHFGELTVKRFITFRGFKSCASPFSKQSDKNQTNIKESEGRKLINIRKISYAVCSSNRSSRSTAMLRSCLGGITHCVTVVRLAWAR